MNTNSSFQDCAWVKLFSTILIFMFDHHLDFFYFLFFRGQAKPSKKAKLSKPVNDSNPSEPEKQQLELSHPIADNIVDDLPPEDHNVDIDPMNTNPSDTNPPSPIRTASHVKPAKEKDDDVTITGHGFTTLGRATVLSRHSAKEEISADDKGKWKVDLESYTQFSAQDIHSGYLSRLYTSRDFQAGLVNLMKECYEVNTATPLYMNILPLATKFTGHDRIECTVNFNICIDQIQ